MQDQTFSRGEPLRLESAAAATFVTMPASARYFAPFLARERAPAQVARELGVDVGSVTYRIRQMLDLGLVRRTRSAPRAGRAIQHYRSSADSVFAPMDLTPVATLRELFRRSRSDVGEEFEHGGERAWLRIGGDQRWGTHLYRPWPGSDVNRDFVPETMLASDVFWAAVLGDASPAVWDQHASLSLTRESAKRLQRELADLVGRYAASAEAGAGSKPYVLHLGMAPRDLRA